MTVPEHDRSPINAVAWLIWLIGAAAVPLVSRNPLYLTLTFVVIVLVHLSLPQRQGSAKAWKLFAYVGSTVAVLAIGFNVLTVHVGDQIFAHLPDWLPIIGGQLTVNALVYGVSSALAISALLFAAATFNSAVRHGDLVRVLPASFSRFGIAGSIALTFVPQTISAGRDIYDAQRARGHRYRGLRDARAFIVPLLSTGLERAMVLSEALETRGFGAPLKEPMRRRGSTVVLLAAVVLLVVSLIVIAVGEIIAGLITLLVSLCLVLFTMPVGAGRSRLHRTVWDVPSVIVAITAGVPVGLVTISVATGFSLSYEPFPVLVAPDFNVIAGFAIVCLLTPAIWSRP